jgi:DNA-binding transcriptional LysR family regulator
VLTEAGQAFREDAAAALEKLEFAKRKAQWASAGKLGHIRIGFISTAGLEIVPNPMRRFLKSYPDVDVGFLRLPIENRKEIEVTTVHGEPFVAMLPSGHSLSAKKEIRLRELKGNPFVPYAREYAPGFHDLLTGMLSNAGVIPDVVQIAGEMPTLVSHRRCWRGRIDCPSICCKKNRLQGGCVLNYRSTAGVRNRLGLRAAEHGRSSTPIL